MTEELINNLKKRNFIPHHCDTKEEAKELILDLVKEGETVAWGGSASLEETGVFEGLRKREDIRVLDRKKDPEAMKKAFYADTFLTSVNSLLADGRIINIDGRGNRVAATIYGPKKLIFLIGSNKITEGTLEDGIRRAKDVAAPPNAKRLDKKVPCKERGECTDCSSPERICRSIGILEWIKDKEAHVILVDEELGY
ncbi:MAG: lactate utilization protein [Nanobdellota archaeon]